MKLHRFVAANDQKAMFLVNQALGSDALIYSTKSVTNGVEILAGLPSDGKEDDSASFLNVYKSELTNFDTKANDTNDEAIRALQSKLDFITDKINSLSNVIPHQAPQTNTHPVNTNQSSLFAKLFKKKETVHPQTKLTDYTQLTKLIKSIKLPKNSELIDNKKIIALVGPTGIGKTTTILKLAKRHISKHGADTLGIITTDYSEIAEKNLIPYYKNIYNFDLEFASNNSELSLILKAMTHKKLILIDTHGISQRNRAKVKELTDIFSSQADKIATYYVLPCNAQEAILDDVIKTYRSDTIQGCILTKQDECASLEPTLKVVSSHGLPIEYVCHGQNLHSDIQVPSTDSLTQLSINVTEMND